MPRKKAEGGAEEVTIRTGSTNVFADLGLENADELQMKSELARQLYLAIKERGWNLSQAARELDIDRSRISALVNGHLEGFTLDRLGRFLKTMNRDLVLTVVKRNRRGRWRVAA